MEGLLVILAVCALPVAILVAVAILDRDASATGEVVVEVVGRGEQTSHDDTSVTTPTPPARRSYANRARGEGTRRGRAMAVTINDDASHELRDALKELTRAQGETALILAKLSSRVDNIDEKFADWRKQQEDDRGRRSYQRFWREEGENSQWRGWTSIAIAACALLVTVLQHIHWN